MEIMTYDFQGVHILGELYGIDSKKINSLDIMENILSLGIEKAKVTAHGILVKKFIPQGITMMVLLSESHISIHTYPENNCLFFDVFTCGDQSKPEEIVNLLIEILSPISKNIKIIKRGKKNEVNK